VRRRSLVFVAASMVARAGAAQQRDSIPVHEEEFRFVIDYLKRTSLMMHDAVRYVSPKQWTFKAKPFRWSVAECAEHIILAERWLMTEFENKFAKGDEPAYIFHWRKPRPTPKDFTMLPLAERRIIDLRLLNDMLDRSKVDTSIPSDPPPEVSLAPRMNYKTPEDMLAEFDTVRNASNRIITQERANLRNYYVYPGSSAFLLDGYQYVIRIPSHCERHLMQLQEVKRDPVYPKQ
jgi:hypothetical protein